MVTRPGRTLADHGMDTGDRDGDSTCNVYSEDEPWEDLVLQMS